VTPGFRAPVPPRTISGVLTCDRCGFDGSEWSANDVERTLSMADDLIGHVVAGGPDPPSDLDHRGAIDGDDPEAAVHAVMHRLDELARWRRAREPFEPMSGTVSSLQTSGGGVPKRGVDVAEIGRGGMAGDVQGNRHHHGRPWQAICLYSRDVLDALVTEGHPIVAGGAGENLTLSGVDWSRIRGGLTISVGEVRLRTSGPTTPCRKIAGCFLDRDWNRIHHGHHPGWSRWYASVITGGTIRRGDPVIVTS
jgi:hypothetical protein